MSFAMPNAMALATWRRSICSKMDIVYTHESTRKIGITAWFLLCRSSGIGCWGSREVSRIASHAACPICARHPIGIGKAYQICVCSRFTMSGSSAKTRLAAAKVRACDWTEVFEASAKLCVTQRNPNRGGRRLRFGPARLHGLQHDRSTSCPPLGDGRTDSRTPPGQQVDIHSRRPATRRAHFRPRPAFPSTQVEWT
jgi:hypothetical protein